MKAQEAKKKLLNESVRLIHERGLGALSFREMARRAGVSHQAPYHHFSNREGILAAIALDGFSRLDECLLEVRARREELTAEEVLRRILRAYMRFAIRNPVHYRLFFRPELVNLAHLPEVRERAMLAFSRLADSVSECHPDLAPSDPRVEQIANVLWAGAHGLADLWIDGPMRGKSPKASIEAMIEMAAQMFSRAGASST